MVTELDVINFLLTKVNYEEEYDYLLKEIEKIRQNKTGDNNGREN